MVGNAGNDPVRRFRIYFATPDLQSGSRITSHIDIGSGSGSHTHLKKFMRLLSVHWSSFPQLKLVESAGNAPASACLQGKCIACLPRPQINWHAVSVLPRASWVLETRLRKLARGVSRLVRLPGIAPGRAPWQGAILLLNHNREIKGPEASLRLRPVPFQ